MHPRTAATAIVLALLLAATAAGAETVYVVDLLRVAVRPAPSGGKPLEIVETGTPLEVLERRGQVLRVRTPRGTQGWLAAAYTMEATPARERLPEIEARAAELKRALTRARTEAAQEAEQRRALAGRVRDLERELETARARLAETTSELERLRGDRARERERMMAAAGGAGGLAATAFLAGGWWYRRRASRRLGGLRV